MMKYSLLISFFLCTTIAFAQKDVKKEATAIFTSLPVKIDGDLNEAAWAAAPVISGFTETRPVYGRPQPNELRTEVKILYDNTSLYIGAVMHSRTHDSIAHEIAARDNVGNADFFMVLIDTYNTGINGFGFMATSTNSQYDARYSNDNNGEDPSWNAVWESATRIVGNEWIAEIRIPYSELRFAKKDIQEWGINFMTRQAKSQRDYFWNEVNPTKAGFVNQWGVLKGIHDIKPPVRLSFTPYLSTYTDHYPYNLPDTKNTSRYFNAGMDVKYGINESFTLDATLVPDFGQVQSDNKILNLTPFEVKYNDYRSFFTEGTELFNKGNLFYSRRIGGTPIYHDSVAGMDLPGKRLLSNPTESKLINAVKISGRTRHGLGIGFFNAVTGASYAEVLDSTLGIHPLNTNPLTNYNILIADQSLKNNSSVTLINTNVTRIKNGPDANVSAGLFNLFTKNNRYNLNGQLTVSQIYGAGKPASVGHYYMVSGGKSSGKFNAIAGFSMMDDKYNPNDLGILFNNNEIDRTLNLSYNIVKPGKWYNSFYINAGTNYSSHYVPYAFQNWVVNYNMTANLKNLWTVNLFGDLNPVGGNDFYEPRTPGWIFKTPKAASWGLYLQSSRGKKYMFTSSLTMRKKWLFDGSGLEAFIDQIYRLNSRFSFEHSISWIRNTNNTGYAATLSSPDSIIFGRRNIHTIENIITAKYNFSANMGFSIRVRHYVSAVHYLQYFLLDKSGELNHTSHNEDHDINLNLFNTDFIYFWWFAPGSQLSISWKNSLQNLNNSILYGLVNNIHYSLEEPHENNLSLKILYYINYQQIKILLNGHRH